MTTHDGSSYRYATPITFTSADTWTKFTHKIPGNSNLQFDQDAGRGLQMYWTLFRGTNTTDNSFTINQWAAYNGSIRYPDITSTWYTTNDATFELTGVQLEVGDTATSFEFRLHAEELARCQRYFQKIDHRESTGSSGYRYMYYRNISFNTSMRAAPSLIDSTAYNSDSGNFVTYTQGDYSTTTNGCQLRHATTSQITVSGTDGAQYHDIRGRVQLSSEL